MREVTKVVQLFQFHELSPKAREAALRQRVKDVNEGPEGQEFSGLVFEWATRAGQDLGWDIKEIYYSGFYSQGDGACFTGSWSYAEVADSTEEVNPKFLEIFKEIKELSENLKTFINVTQVGRYCHSNSASFDYTIGKRSRAADVTRFIAATRKFMDLIYSELREAYESITSEQAAVEYFADEEVEFTQDGRVWNG